MKKNYLVKTLMLFVMGMIVYSCHFKNVNNTFGEVPSIMSELLPKMEAAEKQISESYTKKKKPRSYIGAKKKLERLQKELEEEVTSSLQKRPIGGTKIPFKTNPEAAVRVTNFFVDDAYNNGTIALVLEADYLIDVGYSRDYYGIKIDLLNEEGHTVFSCKSELNTNYSARKPDVRNRFSLKQSEVAALEDFSIMSYSTYKFRY